MIAAMVADMVVDVVERADEAPSAEFRDEDGPTRREEAVAAFDPFGDEDDARFATPDPVVVGAFVLDA